MDGLQWKALLRLFFILGAPSLDPSGYKWPLFVASQASLGSLCDVPSNDAHELHDVPRSGR